MSASVLAATLGYTKVTETVRKAVRELMAVGELEYTEPDNLRSRNQKLKLASGKINPGRKLL